MLLQTNSYIVAKEKRAAHENLMKRFRQVLMKIGCDHFEVYEQVGANWTGGETSGRFVQLMKFRDRKHCQAVQVAERKTPAAQALVREFCDLIDFPYQEQQGLFAHGYYNAVIEPIKVRPNDLAYHTENESSGAEATGTQRNASNLASELGSESGAPVAHANDIESISETEDSASASPDSPGRVTAP